jgi:gamma-glutamyltranspeptidase/glutathione hydrolase
LIILRDGKPVLASSSIGTGLHEQTLQSVVNVLEYQMDPKSAVDTSQFVRPAYAASANTKLGDQVFAEGDFATALLDAVRAKGIGVAVVPPGQARGVSGGWVGVVLDPKTGRRWAAAPRHYNGWALGY